MKHQYLQGAVLFIVVAVIAVVLQSPPNPLEDSSQKIVVQVKSYIVLDQFREFNSQRDNTEAVNLVKEANRIWEPSNITFNFTGVEFIQEPYQYFIDQLFSTNSRYLPVSDADITIYFVNQISANGVALSQINSIVVKDKTTVNSFRTVAHELGHILGLPHVFDSQQKLMFGGTNGEILSQEEIIEARRNALALTEKP